MAELRAHYDTLGIIPYNELDTVKYSTLFTGAITYLRQGVIIQTTVKGRATDENGKLTAVLPAMTTFSGIFILQEDGRRLLRFATTPVIQHLTTYGIENPITFTGSCTLRTPCTEDGSFIQRSATSIVRAHDSAAYNEIQQHFTTIYDTYEVFQ